MPIKNKVSIITPNYNGVNYLGQAIESVINQTWADWEMIIIDDCSTDQSVSLIEHYRMKEPRIKLLFSQKNAGPANARNIGIYHARGQYIAFLDSDDIWLPQKLEKQIDFMRKNDLVLTYSSYEIIDCQNFLIGRVDAPLRLTFDEELKGNAIGNLTALYDQIKLGKRKFKCIGHEDYLFWLTMMQEIVETKGMVEVLAQYRLAKNSISSNKLNAAIWTWNIYYYELKLGVMRSSYYFIYYCLKSLNKYRKLVGK